MTTIKTAKQQLVEMLKPLAFETLDNEPWQLEMVNNNWNEMDAEKFFETWDHDAETFSYQVVAFHDDYIEIA